jgi:hypothetical protein
MAGKPFLAKVPEEMIDTPAKREFWDYAIRFWNEVGVNSNTASAAEDIQSLYQIYNTEESQVPLEDREIFQDSTIFLTRTQTGGFTTAVDREFVTAYSGASIRFMDNPPENAIIKVRIGDTSGITVTSRVKVDGSFSQTYTTAGSVYDFYYIITDNTWVIG